MTVPAALWAAVPRPTLDPFHDLAELWRYPFMRHALVAGAAVAVMGAVVGWFVVLRKEAYAAHSLAMVAFPGATAAVLVGVAPVLGYFAAAVAGAVVMATLETGRVGATAGPGEGEGAPASGVRRSHSAVVGTVQAGALALGLLFASLYQGFLANVTSFLFGSVLGVSATEAAVLVLVTVAVLGLVVAAGRPLLFASVDPAVAVGAGLPVDAITAGFLVVVGLAVAAVSQFTGVLLVFSLLVTPPATAQVLTARPGCSLAAAVGIGVAVVWAGLGAAFFTDRPAGFWITTLGFGTYVAARAGTAAARRGLVTIEGRRER